MARVRENLPKRPHRESPAPAARGKPVIELLRTTYCTGNRPGEVMRSIIAGDMASFCYDFPIPD
jgi:hypothetical protein